MNIRVKLQGENEETRETYKHDAFWAVKDGKLVFIDDVKCGKDCGCICPNPLCKAPMIAKNSGKKKVHHFAHLKGMSCDGAYETIMHLLAKEIILEKKCVMVPAYAELGIERRLVRLHNIKVEEFDKEYGIKPDIEGLMEDGRRLLIEIKVSHQSEKKKIDIIKHNKLLCIEIDVNMRSQNKDRLADFLTNSYEYRKWLGPEEKTIPVVHEGESHSSCRSLYLEGIVYHLKNLFAEKKLQIRPESDCNPNITYRISRVPYLLDDYAYDTWEMNKKHNGFYSDLLVYRNAKDYKGWISINVKFRRRKRNFRRPDDLRIIDIIIPKQFEEDNILPETIFSDNQIKSFLGEASAEFTNFKIKDPLPSY